MGHRIFAAVYERAARVAERGFMGRVRRELIEPAEGEVLEIGAGTGLSFAHYGARVERVVAVEPDKHMLAHAARRARARDDDLIELRQLGAERLPFADRSFDTAISSLALCSMTEPEVALAEIRRVLRPDGTLRFYEHVRSDGQLGARAQDAIAPLWGRVAGGCHPNRDTVRLIEEAGFAILELARSHVGPPLPPSAVVRPHVLGVARVMDLSWRSADPPRVGG